MFRILTLVLISLLMTAAPAMAEKLTIERIFDEPSLDGPTLRKPKLAPDGSRVTFLREKEDDAEQLDLWEYHVGEGKLRLLVDSRQLLPAGEQLSDEEKARRERQRIAGLKGIVEYDWAPDSQGLLFPLGGDLYYYDLASRQPRQLTDSDAFETDPQVSPGGRYVAFVRDQDLYVVEIATGREQRLTHDGGGVIRNAMAEFVAQEEMDRDTGYWWAPGDTKIAFLQVDESPVAVTQRYEIHADELKVIDQRYPYTGTPNVRLRLGVVSLADQQIQWLDLGDEPDIYVPRVRWLPDGRRLSYQRQSRDQRTLELRVADVASGEQRTVIREQADTFVNLHRDLRYLADGERFVWSSERDGFRHLYLGQLDDGSLAPLTTGDWQVDELEGLDEQGGWVYFTATRASPLERQLYRVPLDGSGVTDPERLTRREGDHDVEMSRSADVFVDTFSTRDQPPQVSLHRSDGRQLTWLVENALDADHPYHPYLRAHRPTEFGTLTAEDGQTLHYRVTTPPGDGPHPVMIHVYGGPHAQMVSKSWSRRILFEQYMAQHGYIVFALDNRGSARRGTRFENPIHRAMGGVEVADQMRGVAYLRSRDDVDPDRIGVFGWSYGGYMTLHLMLRHPDQLAAGVAVAPVTDWALYDTHYTERYMGTPQDNPQGYEQGSVFPYTQGFDRPLLVVHGMADDNVLFTHSTRLFEHLQQQGVLFEAMPYPGAKHGISGQAGQTHVYRTIAGFFSRHLQ